MKKVLAFDVYGTLINTHGITEQLAEQIGDLSASFSQAWRQKQLEYSFRRGLMKEYVNFAQCTKQALDFTCLQLNTELSDDSKKALLNAYQTLPAFADVQDALEELSQQNILVAFSNGTEAAVDKLLQHADIKHFFSDIVSVDEIKTFKPNPDIYQHLMTRTHSNNENTWLISSNPFDIIGADAVKMKTAWIKRSSSDVFDPWGVEPTYTCNDLLALNKYLGNDDNFKNRGAN